MGDPPEVVLDDPVGIDPPPGILTLPPGILIVAPPEEELELEGIGTTELQAIKLKHSKKVPREYMEQGNCRHIVFKLNKVMFMNKLFSI
ncbi:MAG: hypothetical protein CBC09_06320 [Cellvibrionales bacterium TMED49]|nr:hypothetical protein [Porticoccaceae bacterium]OUU37875.1 MAG: hypothetical protein CBC09_06320 [Cellvibrionales bacterium TMED49]